LFFSDLMREFQLRKLYYSISEVSKITEIEQYVLRFWENEFEQLRPAKNRAGNRIYTNKDIDLILHIKHLLKEKKYTIEGAKTILINEKNEKPAEPQKAESVGGLFEEEVKINTSEDEDLSDGLRKDLLQIRTFLAYLLEKL